MLVRALSDSLMARSGLLAGPCEGRVQQDCCLLLHAGDGWSKRGGQREATGQGGATREQGENAVTACVAYCAIVCSVPNHNVQPSCNIAITKSTRTVGLLIWLANELTCQSWQGAASES